METKIAVYGILKNKDKILLLHRKKPDVWEFPGGGIIFGEQPDFAVKREVLEETGLKVESVELLSIKTIVYPSENIQQIAIMYLCKPKMTKIQLENAHLEYLWVSVHGIKNIENLGFSVERCLEDLKKLK